MKVNSMQNIRINQKFGSNQNWSNKQETHTNMTNQYNGETVKRFSMREQINNSKFRDTNDSHLSTVVQDLTMSKKRFSYLTSEKNEQQESNDKSFNHEITGKTNGGNNTSTSFLNSNGQKNVQPQYETNPSTKEKNSSYTTLTYAQIAGSSKNVQENDGSKESENSKSPLLSTKIKENDYEETSYNNKSKNQPSKMQYSNIHSGYQKQDQELQKSKKINNGEPFRNGVVSRNSDNQFAQNNILRNERASNYRKRDTMYNINKEANDSTENQFHEQKTNKYLKEKTLNSETNDSEFYEPLTEQSSVPEQRNYRNNNKNKGFSQNAQNTDLRGTSRERRALNINAPLFEKTPNFINNKARSESTGSPENNPQAAKEGLIIRVVNTGGGLEGKVFRIGDDLFIPSFFSGLNSAKKPLSNLVTQDLAGNILSNQELSRVAVNIDLKNFHKEIQEEQLSKNPPSEPSKPDILERIMQLERGNSTPKAHTKKPAEPPSTDASSNLVHTSSEKNDNFEQGKTGKSTRPVNDATKMRCVSSDSEEDELMFQNELYQNVANSNMSLKQKLARMKDKVDINADRCGGNHKNIPSKLTFAVDVSPVAWIVEEQQPRKQLKTGVVRNGAMEETESAKKLTLSTNRVVSNQASSYKILGQESMRFTRETNLLEKLENYIIKAESAETEVKKDNTMTPEEQEADAAEKEAQKQLDEHYNFASRYFAANPTKSCNRCKLTGHFESMCPEAIKIMCLFCCKKHDTSQCNSVICFHCYNTGHRAKDCREHSNLTCFRCNKKGHKNVECGVILPPKSHYNDDKVIREKRNTRLSSICLTCGRSGHYNCNRAINFGDTNKIDNIYDLAGNAVQEPKDAQKNSAPALNNTPALSNRLQPIQECPDGNQSDGSVDSEDQKFLKRSAEKKNPIRRNSYLNAVSVNQQSFNSYNRMKEGNQARTDYSRSNLPKPQYKVHEFRNNFNRDRSRRNEFEQMDS